jgi:hypothetical protein
VTARVQGIDVKILGERIDLPHEILAVLSVSVQENQRLSHAFFGEMMLDVHPENSFVHNA